MTIKHDLGISGEALVGFSPQVIGSEFERNKDFSKTSLHNYNLSVNKNRCDNEIIQECITRGILENVREKLTQGSDSTVSVYTISTMMDSIKLENALETETGPSEIVDPCNVEHFKLEFSNKVAESESLEESEELAMDYPSLCPLDINEVKARRRELEARKFQEELEKMAIQLADRLKKIPAISRRSYKKESIYVKDLYTLTYEEGQTLESIDYVSNIYV